MHNRKLLLQVASPLAGVVILQEGTVPGAAQAGPHPLRSGKGAKNRVQDASRRVDLVEGCLEVGAHRSGRRPLQWVLCVEKEARSI